MAIKVEHFKALQDEWAGIAERLTEIPLVPLTEETVEEWMSERMDPEGLRYIRDAMLFIMDKGTEPIIRE